MITLAIVPLRKLMDHRAHPIFNDGGPVSFGYSVVV